MTTAVRAFISYKSEYRDIASRLRDTLQTWGYGTWFDVDDIKEGFFRDAIQQGLESASVVIGILTPEALKSREVLSEWNYAYTRDDKRLLLLRYRDVELPYWLEPVQYFDCETDETHGLEQLKTALESPAPSDGVPRPTPPEELTRHDKPSETIAYNTDAPTDDNRSKMLFNVHNAWIKGALYENLPQGATDLGVSVQPDAVLRHDDYGDYTLPDSSRDIGDIFGKVNGQLLILGDPGSGKTVLLLQLAERLIAQAQHDSNQPMPAVFNLSSWGQKQPPFDEWLVGELKLGYGVPKKTAQDWIENSRLTLLLDGLDEIALSSAFMPGADTDTLEDRAVELRSACIEAINKFQKQYPKVDIVVCSRIKDYDALTAKLDLNSAILLHPLSDVQINDFLADGDTQGIRDLLKADTVAQDMARSPFLLTLMKEAYDGLPYEDTPFNQLKLDNPTETTRRDHLLEKYAEQHIKPDAAGKYTEKNIRHWLSWLAWQMMEHQTSLFYIEDLQPDWANTTSNSRYIAIILLSMGTIGVFTFGLANGVLLGFLFGCILVMIARLRINIQEIEFAENLTFSLLAIVRGLIIIFMFAFLIENSENNGSEFDLLYVLLSLMVWLIIEVTFGLKTESGINLRLKPNVGFLQSAKNGIPRALLIGIISGIIGSVIFTVYGGLDDGIKGGWTISLIAGLTIWLVGGGLASIQHFALRNILASEGVIPRWRYDKFLDHCADLGLLRKVGGGYIFRHRWLLEYFDSQYFRLYNPIYIEMREVFTDSEIQELIALSRQNRKLASLKEMVDVFKQYKSE